MGVRGSFKQRPEGAEGVTHMFVRVRSGLVEGKESRVGVCSVCSKVSKPANVIGAEWTREKGDGGQEGWA